MKTYTITSDFITPPINHGQTVTVSYGLAADDEAIIRRTHDASDGTVIFEAFGYPRGEQDWAPWNGEPTLGRKLGKCLVE